MQRSGSSIPLKRATSRQAAASPYSAKATDASESPVDQGVGRAAPSRCRRSGSAATARSASPRARPSTGARIGRPSAVKQGVLGADRGHERREAGDRRPSAARPGVGWASSGATLFSVGTVQLNSFSTAATTLPSCVAGGVEEHLQGELARLRAGELRRSGRLRALGGLALPLRGLLDAHLLGVELEGDAAALRRRPCRLRGSGRTASGWPCASVDGTGRRQRARAVPPRRRRGSSARWGRSWRHRPEGLGPCEAVVGELQGLGRDLR